MLHAPASNVGSPLAALSTPLLANEVAVLVPRGAPLAPGMRDLSAALIQAGGVLPHDATLRVPDGSEDELCISAYLALAHPGGGQRWLISGECAAAFEGGVRLMELGVLAPTLPHPSGALDCATHLALMGEDNDSPAGISLAARFTRLAEAGFDVRRALASELGKRDYPATLIEALARAPGVDVNATDSRGWTALMHAAVRGDVQAVRTLLAVPGIDINQRIPNRAPPCTALGFAVSHGHLEIVRTLLATPGIDTAHTDPLINLAHAAVNVANPATALFVQTAWHGLSRIPGLIEGAPPLQSTWQCGVAALAVLHHRLSRNDDAA